MINNVYSALLSIWSNKVRSVLTVVGVVIGVASVTTLVSLGEGLKQDVSGLIQGFGTNVITIISGKIDTTSRSQTTNPANFITGDILTIPDVEKIEKTAGIEAVTPLSVVAGSVKNNDKTAAPAVFGTYPNYLQAFQILRLDKGQSFEKQNAGNVVILADTPRKELFGDDNPIGKKITIAKEEFEVIGTLGKAQSSSLFGSEFDNIAIIPFDTATHLNKDQVKILRIVAKASDTSDVNAVKDSIRHDILANHDGEDNFTVLTQENILGLFDKFLTLATTLVSAIAAISLVVGGIGIMNIMLVTVTERTKEIGIRKAVGATKIAILIQFLTEAIMVTLVGSLLGLAIAYIVDIIVRAQSELTPVITPSVILIAVAISVIIGVIFGLWPALRAANKDPIDALRYE